MTARYAVYDPRTDQDIGEFPDLPEAYAEMDRLMRLHDRTYGVRIAQEHRAQVEREWEVKRVRGSLVGQNPRE